MMTGKWRRTTPRQQFEKVLQTSFGQLSSAIIDGFFANFGYSMPLSLLDKIQSLCREIKPNLVIEFGSGLSTVVITEALSEYERGFLVSIDENMEWLARSYQSVGHVSRAAFICLPLDDRINHAALSEYLSLKGKPELVIIDGPSKGARFSLAAIKIYHELLSSSCICIVDDTDREENDLGAMQLATDFSLRKNDYGDPIYVKHRYSVLLPAHIEDELLST